MKVRYIGESDPITFTDGKDYTVLSIERGWYRILVNFGDDYLFPPEIFEVVEGGPEDLPEDKPENWWQGSQGGVNGVVKVDEEKIKRAFALLDEDLARARAQKSKAQNGEP